jgi:signal transduction histidine kinase
MNWFQRYFVGLRRRLILSYIAVTLAFVFTLMIGVAGLRMLSQKHESRQSQLQANSQPLEELVAPQIAPYLQQSPPDKQELTGWSYALMSHSGSSFNKSNQIWNDFYGVSSILLVQIIDHNGQMLTITSAKGIQTRTIIASSQAQIAIHTAIENHLDDLTGLAYPLPTGQVAMAVPIRAYNGHFLGVLFTVITGNTLADGQNSNHLYLLIFLLMLPLGLIGILSGILISQDFTWRLQHLAHAAENWSQGQFYVKVYDRANDELGQLAYAFNNMAEQLQHLLRTREELVVLEERQRLGRDLHDSVKQQLFVMTMLVGAARAQLNNSSQVEQTLREVEHLAGQIHLELTTLIHALRPVELAKKGLKTALREFTDLWSKSTGISAQLYLPEQLCIPLGTEQALFRIAQEAFVNVARHSGAQHVEMKLNIEQKIIQFSIRDDGHGFDVNSRVGRGVGLASICERVEELNGTVSLSSAANGTLVSAHIPFAVEKPRVASDITNGEKDYTGRSM